MDFGWTPTEEELSRRAFDFARANLNGSVAERDREHRFGAAEWASAGGFGFAGLCVAERWGGMGLGVLQTAHIVEALGRGCEDAGLVFSICAHLFACAVPVERHAGEALRDRVLPKLARGEWIGANAITEADAGSDVFALKTTAKRDGAEYVLNGAKSYVTNGPVADATIVYAMTAPDDGYLGVSAFMVERDAPGIIVGKPFAKMGLTTSPISSVYFDDCRVSAENLLGGEGKGAHVFTDSMRWERACLFAAYLGAMERQLDRTIAYANQRRQFRRPIGKHQAVAHRIADMKLRLEAARLLVYRACWEHDRGGDATLAIALGKLAVSEAAIQSSLDAIHLHGGLGFVVEAGIERALRDAIPAAIFSGTSEIQRDLIASRLGL